MSNWPKVKLGDLLRRSEESLAILPDVEYKQITVRLWGKGVVLRGVLTGAAIAAQRQTVAKQGQFIISRIDARSGAFGMVPCDLDGSLVTSDFPVFNVAKDRLEPAYLGWICRTRTFVEECKRASEGTTNRVRLQEDKFLALAISLPPLVEQRSVVARIEELAGRLNEASNLRNQVAKETEALLTSARRDFIAETQAEVVALEDACCAIIDNLHSNPRLAETGIPCIRSPDVGYGILNLESARRTDEEEYCKRTARGEPRAGDIIFVREGGGTGKCAVVEPDQRFSLGQRVMMMRPNTERILPRFFLHQLLSPLVQEAQIAPKSKGSASPHLNIGALKRFNLILPALREQRRIVGELDALQAQVGLLARLQTETATEINALLPSILDRAFKGEL